MASRTAQTPLWRLQRLLLALLVIAGTITSLLLAHSLGEGQPAQLAQSISATSSAVSSSGVDSGAPAGISDAAVTTSAAADDLRDTGIALCAAVAFACGLALLAMALRLPARTRNLALARSSIWRGQVGVASAARLPVTLTALCISRV